MLARRVLLIGFCCLVVSACHAQNGGPVLKVYAYERDVVPGIPPGGPGAPGIASQELRGKQYFLYVETKDLGLVVDGVWLNGQFHQVETAVKTGPILMSGPVAEVPSERNTLVPASSNHFIEILVKDTDPRSKLLHSDTARLLKNNAAVIELTDKGKSVSWPVPSFAKKPAISLP